MNAKYAKGYIQQINKLCNEINVFTEKHQEMLMRVRKFATTLICVKTFWSFVYKLHLYSIHTNKIKEETI